MLDRASSFTLYLNILSSIWQLVLPVFLEMGGLSFEFPCTWALHHHVMQISTFKRRGFRSPSINLRDNLRNPSKIVGTRPCYIEGICLTTRKLHLVTWSTLQRSWLRNQVTRKESKFCKAFWPVSSPLSVMFSRPYIWFRFISPFHHLYSIVFMWGMENLPGD